MKHCFIPGFACSAHIFEPVKESFKDSFCVEWPLEDTRKIKTMSELCKWTLKSYESNLLEADVLVGHSLGGGVAFELSYLPQFRGKQVVLVDYFLTMPPPFFRNYCSNETPKTIQDYITAMLDFNRPHFNRSILDTISPYTVERLHKRQAKNGKMLFAIYGMRSEPIVENVRKALELPDEVASYMEFKFIPQSAHFPMVERPAEFSKAVRSIVC